MGQWFSPGIWRKTRVSLSNTCKRVASRVHSEIGNVSLSLSLYRNRRPRDPCSGRLASSRGRSPRPGGCATCMTKYLHGPYVLYSLCSLHSTSTRAQVLTLTAFESPLYISCLPPLSKSGGSAVDFRLFSLQSCIHRWCFSYQFAALRS